MYTRETHDIPKSFVKGGKPVFGTFRGHPVRFDIRGVYRPYAVMPLPVFITNLRIKSRLVFSFDAGEYIGRISFIDAKVVGFSEVVFWNKTTKQKFVYHSLLGPKKRLVPHDLESASTSNFSKKRRTLISWDRKKNKLSVKFDLKGDSVRPNAKASLSAIFSDSQFAEMTSVRPNPTFRRSCASYDSVLPLRGTVTLSYRNGEKKEMQSEDGISFFSMIRSYMMFSSHGESVSGFGHIDENVLSFKISAESHEAVNPERYNCNVLFYNGKATALPPAVITHYSGMNQKWVIQDTENMIDLTFTPLSSSVNSINALVVRSIYHTIYGVFEGTFVTADGEKISFKSLSGIAEKYLIRL